MPSPAHDAEPWVEHVVAGFEEGQRLSIVGPGDVRTHIAHARAMAGVLDVPGRALDLGSGAGIPGLVLAGLWPESRWVLLDAALRRVRLVEQVVERLGWTDRVEVVHGRAELLGRDATYRGRFDLVTARLFAGPAVTAECGAPFLRLGGVLAVTEPPGAHGERWPAAALRPLGLEPDRVEAGVQRLVRAHPIEDRFPRNVGVPERRPLF